MKISDAGLDLIQRFEGCKLKAYQDSVHVWTIGVGHTGDVQPGQEITQEEAMELLRQDVEDAEKCVNVCVTAPLSQGQFDALVSFCFNLGCGALRRSTLLQKVNASDFDGASREFVKWNKAGGVVLNGLTRRREAEAELFLT